VKTEERCQEHGQQFATREEAVAGLERFVADLKRRGKWNRSAKRLNVYRCGNHFHYGRAKHVRAKDRMPQPAPKPLSPGQARRKMEHEQREAERHAKRARLFADFNHSVSVAMAELDRELALTAAAQGGK
jgi:hypothetical protein